MPLLGLMLNATIVAQIPVVLLETRKFTLIHPSAAYQVIAGSTVGWGYRQPTAPRKLHLEVYPSSGKMPSIADIDVRSSECFLRDPAGTTSGPLPLARASILRLLTLAQLGRPAAVEQADADELMSIIQSIQLGQNVGSFQTPRSQLAVRSSAVVGLTPRWARPAIVTLTILIWIAGLWLLNRGKNRKSPTDGAQSPDVEQLTN
jgi:hypothetical protein